MMKSNRIMAESSYSGSVIEEKGKSLEVQGVGRMILANGFISEGLFKKELPHGFCREIFDDSYRHSQYDEGRLISFEMFDLNHTLISTK